MNLDLRTITTFPLRIVGLDSGRALLNAAPDRLRHHGDGVATWSREHRDDARGTSPADPALRHRANVGEGRPL
jgi:hypothetical protein